MAIQVLDQETINKIAAGEVIERPSSVVKELVENAIDAGATAVTIEIKDGGISFIRITDNGCGIDGSEIAKAFLRHSTSKIKSIEDLIRVSSLGFRGEALSSIAAVAQIELITKTAESFTGYRYCIEGGEEKNMEEVGAPDGTTFIVRNLFFNTPVRRKFLKTAATEAGYVSSLLEHLALSHPDVSFRFINNNQNRLHTSGNMNLKDIIYNVYGRDITRNLIEIDGKTQDIEMTGFIGKPMICRGNRTYENYYINGRYIKSSIITKAVEEAYKGYIMPHNYPFTAIHFKINPAILDVNVHPTKMELRFSKNDFVYHFVLDTLRSALKSSELAPQVPVGGSRMPAENALQRPLPASPSLASEHSAPAASNYQAPALKPLEPAAPVGPIEQTKGAPQKGSGPSLGTDWYTKKDYKVRLPEPFETRRSDEMIAEANQAAVYAKNEAEQKQLSLFENPLMNTQNLQKYRIIGQLFATYWLIEFEDKFYMMDQHAAHEKVLYEKMMRHLKEKPMDTQMLMPPVVLNLNLREEQVLKSHWAIFSRVGYEIEEFGGNAYKVTGIPAGLPNIDAKQMLTDLLDGLADDHKGDLEIITEKVATMSCKAAVKGNNTLSFKEAEALMQELMLAENPYNCPHGRPTLIVMTKYEIEKKFKRIL